MKLSVVISVHNGEDTLKECLESVISLNAEIIVMDHASTDRTAEIAKKFTKQVFSVPNDPEHMDEQKNIGFEKATGTWILSLDADEQLTRGLVDEIGGVINGDQENSGYFIPRKNMIFGKWIEHAGWYPDFQLRLFRNGKGKYTKSHVHEDLSLDGDVGYLKEHIEHQNYTSISQFFTRAIFIYAPNEANEKLRNGYTFSYSDAFRFPFQEFLSRFFAREGYRDGFHGLMLSLLMAFYHFVIFCFLWEKEKFKDNEKSSFLFFEKESSGMQKELRYWIHTKHIEETKNPVTKTILKGKRKLDNL